MLSYFFFELGELLDLCSPFISVAVVAVCIYVASLLFRRDY